MSIPIPDFNIFAGEARASSQIITSGVLPIDKCRRITDLCESLNDFSFSHEQTVEEVLGIYTELVALTQRGSQFSKSVFIINSIPKRCFSELRNEGVPESIKKAALDLLVNLSYCFGFEEGTLKNKLAGQYSLNILIEMLLSGAFIDEVLTILINYSTTFPGIFEITNTQIFEELQTFIGSADNPDCTNRALWIASNLFSTNYNHDKPFIDGAIQFFLQFCKEGIAPFCSRALIGLSNIIRKNKEYCEQILSSLDISVVFAALGGEPDLPAAAISFLSNAMNPEMAESFPQECFPDLLANPILHDSAAILLSEIFENSEAASAASVSSGALAALLECCKSNESDTCSASSVMVAINSAPEAVLPTVIEAGFIPFAVSLLDQSNKSCSLIVLNFIQTLISVTDEALRKTIIEQLIESESIELVETWMSDPDIGQVADALYPLLEEAINS